ncbi:hypothetical protein E4U39_000277, partial [Claviceps sp. Clav50 group G5]
LFTLKRLRWCSRNSRRRGSVLNHLTFKMARFLRTPPSLPIPRTPRTPSVTVT